jgi:hypothetical protein
MNSTEKQCGKAITCFTMTNEGYILTYSDGSQEFHKSDFKKIRRAHVYAKAKKREKFTKKYPSFQVNPDKMKLFDYVACGGYHTLDRDLHQLRNNKSEWSTFMKKYKASEKILNQLKAKKALRKIDALINAIIPGFFIGSRTSDFFFPKSFRFNAPIGNLEFSKSLIQKGLLPVNFLK